MVCIDKNRVSTGEYEKTNRFDREFPLFVCRLTVSKLDTRRVNIIEQREIDDDRLGLMDATRLWKVSGLEISNSYGLWL